MRKLFCIILAGLLLGILLTTADAAALTQSDPFIRVGLYYGNNALEYANLQNAAGCGFGYAYGVLDTNGSFVSYGVISEVAITMRAASPTAYTISATGSGAVLAYVETGDSPLCVWPQGIDTVTWFKNIRYRGAFLYQRTDGGRLSVINYLPLEDYIKGVVPYEMGTWFPEEALKAQALCARSYAMTSIGRHGSQGFDLCNTTCCQVYKGLKTQSDAVDRAVEQTAGQYIRYNGEIIRAVYMSSDGGATENAENVWNTPLPYLRAVRDDWEAQTDTTYKSWTRGITARQITQILKARGNDNTDIVHAYAEYTAAGNISRLTFVDSRGKTYDYEKEAARLVLASTDYGVDIKSMRFIFEDAANPRVKSPSEFARPMSGTQDTQSSGIEAAVKSVLSAFGLRPLSEQYPAGSIPILGKSGVTYRTDFQVFGAQSGYTVSDTGINAADLTIPASSSGRYLIVGAGYGHNLGMSQYGAKAMAEAGYTAEQIVKYYYTGVTVG